MNKIKNAKRNLLVLFVFIVGFFLSGGRSNAAPRIEETRNAYGEHVILAVFESMEDFESFFAKIKEIQNEFECKKERFPNMRRIFFYDFVVSEFSEIFKKRFSKICDGNDEELLKKMYRVLARIVIGEPEPVPGAGGGIVSLNYARMEKNFRETIVECFKSVGEAIRSGRGVLPVKMILAP